MSLSLALSFFLTKTLHQPRRFTDDPFGPIADEGKFEHLALECLNHGYQPADKPRDADHAEQASKQRDDGTNCV